MSRLFPENTPVDKLMRRVLMRILHQKRSRQPVKNVLPYSPYLKFPAVEVYR